MTVIHYKGDGIVFKDGVPTGEVIKICGISPKEYTDIMEWFKTTFNPVILKGRD